MWELDRPVTVKDTNYPAINSLIVDDTLATLTGSAAQEAVIIAGKGGCLSGWVQVLKSPLCPFVPRKGVDELTQFDASSGEALELRYQGDDSAIPGHAKSQSPVGSAQSDKEMGVTNPADQGFLLGSRTGDTQVTQVKGRLKANITFWEDISSPDPWIISCIRECALTDLVSPTRNPLWTIGSL